MSKQKEYIPFDPKIDRNVGAYADRLPKWTPSHRAPDGRYLEVWFNHETRDWVVQEFDKNGYEIQSQYCGYREAALMEARMWQNSWYLGDRPVLTEQDIEAGGPIPIADVDPEQQARIKLQSAELRRRWVR